MATVEDDVQSRKRWHEIEERRLKEWENYQRSNRTSSDRTSKVFFDISIGDSPAGRIVIDLLEDVVPQAVNNFRVLATGSAGHDPATGTKLDYVDSPMHRLEKGVGAFFGELQGLQLSSTGSLLKDENFSNWHSQRGIVSMYSRGPNTIGSAFTITLDRAPSLDFKQVVIGRVTDGLQVLEKLEAVPRNRVGRPLVPVFISICGALTGSRPVPTTESPEEKSAS